MGEIVLDPPSPVGDGDGEDKGAFVAIGSSAGGGATVANTASVGWEGTVGTGAVVGGGAAVGNDCMDGMAGTEFGGGGGGGGGGTLFTVGGGGTAGTPCANTAGDTKRTLESKRVKIRAKLVYFFSFKNIFFLLPRWEFSS